MAEICGFCGLRFDERKTGPLATVVTPPYDVISDVERMRLAASNPFNMTHLILPKAADAAPPYEQAARLFNQWVGQGVLLRDPQQRMYLLRQTFRDPAGIMRQRRAFFACLKLPEADERFILGHERTFDKPVADRLALLRATRANLEPIFLMYSDPAGRITTALFDKMAREAPHFAITTSDSVKQELWTTPPSREIQEHFEGQILYIADGHHRFKTACAYRDEQRRQSGAKDGNEPHDYVMAGFVAFEEPGLQIYPAHRVLPNAMGISWDTFSAALGRYFQMHPVPEKASLTEALAAAPEKCAMVLYHSRGAWMLTLDEGKRLDLVGDDRSQAWRDLDVAVLHSGILNKLMGRPETLDLIFEKDSGAATALVDSGAASMAFILRPPSPGQVRACAESFEPMPQKSTYFFPKLPSGTVIYAHEPVFEKEKG